MLITGLFGQHDKSHNLLKEIIIFSSMMSELNKKRDEFLLGNDDFIARKFPCIGIHIF